MSTMGAVSVGFKAARAANKQARVSKAGTRASTSGIRRFIGRIGDASLALCGLGSFTTAAFIAHDIAGFAALGVSLFVAEWRLASGGE